MGKVKNAKIIMLPHSQAKVELYVKYLSVYLKILDRVKFVEKIFIFDLFAGEGIYEDGGKGSPIQAIETIYDHYITNQNKIKDIRIILNDSEYSNIEPNKLKIDRIKDALSSINKPERLIISYHHIPYNDIIPRVIRLVQNLTNEERALIFIDPWGYKEIEPNDIKRLLENGKTEILLFLPVSFMYRFANKAITEGFDGSESLEKFINELFGNQIPDTTNIYKFILNIKERFQVYLNQKYIDTFTIKRDRTNVFCLFFFTSNKKGYHKMIETKWQIDKEDGKGFEIEKTRGLFAVEHSSGFDEVLKDFIFKSSGKTNIEITDYCYEKGFLPKHGGNILKSLHKQNLIEIYSLDGMAVNGYYLNNEARKILIRRRVIWLNQR